MKKVGEGIYQIEIPLPEVGGINLYFLDGDIPTLVDTGPNLPGVKEGIKVCLKRVGRCLEDLRRIIITHGHVDHYGLVGQLREINGADVFMTAPEKELMLDFQLGEENKRAGRNLTSWGVPGKLGEGILRYFEILIGLGGEVTSATYIEPVVQGEVLDAGQWNWQIQCCAGHSPAGLCLFNEDGLMFTGDHLLANISPNPSLNLNKERTLQGGLKEYITSLNDLVSFPVQLCLPGHGPLIYNFRERIQCLLNEIYTRQTRILAIIGKQPKSIFQIGEELLETLRRKLTVPQIWLAMKEVKAHLDLLETDFRVTMVMIEGVQHFQLT